jgi:septum formation protein
VDLVLASTSPSRRAMLTAAGVAFRAIPPGVDERMFEHPDPAKLASLLAHAKAAAVAARTPEAWVLGSDQVGWLDGERLDKPDDPVDHLRRLQRMRGRPHTLHTAWTLLGPSDARVDGATTVTLWMRPDLTDEELAAYVATGEGARCAGGYALEGLGSPLFSRYEGDWFSVLGLPLLDVLDALRGLGWRPGSVA